MPAREGKSWRARWILVLGLAAVALILQQSAFLTRLDHLIYDTFLVWQDNRVSDQVVIAAIDDESLQRLGRWPWSRSLHAKLLERFTQFEAKAVGFDVLFSEPESQDPAADKRLAEALAKNGKTVLAVAPNRVGNGDAISELLPVPDLAVAAAALGHVDIEVDTDGLCRTFFTHAGIGDPRWRSFPLAMLAVAGEPTTVFDQRPSVRGVGRNWVRSGRYYVPFDARQGQVRTIPVHRLLSDDQAAFEVRGRYVLVGSTATGLGDVLSTPVSYDHRRMPGVELNAHILSGLLSGKVSRDLEPAWQQVATVAFVTIGALTIAIASFPLGILLLFAVLALTLAFSAVLLLGWQLWFAPASAMAPLILIFPGWAAWSLFREKRVSHSLAMQVQHQALHHAATNLPNQYVLIERLRVLEGLSEETVSLIVVHIEWSHSMIGVRGDAELEGLMKALADRMRSSVRGEDLIAHMSGDEFGVLVEGIGGVETALRVANTMQGALRRPIEVNGVEVSLVPRIGMSVWPGHSQQIRALLRDAYIAMFRARLESAITPCLFSEELAREVEARSQLELAMVSALKRNEFEVYYQPQVRARDGQLVGFEALLRWNNPKLGLVYPGSFIPVAEHTGLIQEVGSWVLHTACKQAAEWKRQGMGAFNLAVNLSPLQFVDGDLVLEVEEALNGSGLEPGSLELEITESALMQNPSEAAMIMQKLKSLGVKLAIDDFGTGYSSLSHLSNFPFDRIKIDQSFTSSLKDSAEVREITLTIISMAKRLRLSIVAEGVETDFQETFLGENGCDDLQGFLFSRPLPASKQQQLFSKRR